MLDFILAENGIITKQLFFSYPPTTIKKGFPKIPKGLLQD